MKSKQTKILYFRLSKTINFSCPFSSHPAATSDKPQKQFGPNVAPDFKVVLFMLNWTEMLSNIFMDPA